MKLAVFNTETKPAGAGNTKWAKPLVRFNNKGCVTIAKGLCEKLSITAQSKIAFANDEQAPKDWYLFFDKTNGYPIREGTFNKNQVAEINHKALVELFCSSQQLDMTKTWACKLMPEPIVFKEDKTKTEYWKLLIEPAV